MGACISLSVEYHGASFPWSNPSGTIAVGIRTVAVRPILNGISWLYKKLGHTVASCLAVIGRRVESDLHSALFEKTASSSARLVERAVNDLTPLPSSVGGVRTYLQVAPSRGTHGSTWTLSNSDPCYQYTRR